MNEQQSTTTKNTVVCAKCKTEHAPGIVRCENCNSSLRPIGLGIITIVGIVFAVIGIIGSLPPTETPLLSLLFGALNLAHLVILVALRRGYYWAWIVIQILLGFNMIKALGDGIELTVVAIIINLAFWAYLYSRRVRAFCSVGRKF